MGACVIMMMMMMMVETNLSAICPFEGTITINIHIINACMAGITIEKKWNTMKNM